MYTLDVIFTAYKRSLGQGNIFSVRGRWGSGWRRGGLRGRGGCAWQGACMAGGVHVHATHDPPPPGTTRYGRLMRGRYASYWNAFF